MEYIYTELDPQLFGIVGSKVFFGYSGSVPTGISTRWEQQQLDDRLFNSGFSYTYDTTDFQDQVHFVFAYPKKYGAKNISTLTSIIQGSTDIKSTWSYFTAVYGSEDYYVYYSISKVVKNRNITTTFKASVSE